MLFCSVYIIPVIFKVDASAQALSFSRQSALLLQLLASLRLFYFSPKARLFPVIQGVFLCSVKKFEVSDYKVNPM